MHRMIEAFVQQERELWDLANFQGLAEVRANKTRGIAESNQDAAFSRSEPSTEIKTFA